MIHLPIPGLHFQAIFIGLGEEPINMRFKNIDGFTLISPIKQYNLEENPITPNSKNLVLKRALCKNVPLYHWCKKAIEQIELTPLTVVICILDEHHNPAFSWRIYNAIPTKWEMPFLKENINEAIIESLVLSYSYYTLEL